MLGRSNHSVWSLLLRYFPAKRRCGVIGRVSVAGRYFSLWSRCLTSTLRPSVVRFRCRKGEVEMELSGGFCSIRHHIFTIHLEKVEQQACAEGPLASSVPYMREKEQSRWKDHTSTCPQMLHVQVMLLFLSLSKVTSLFSRRKWKTGSVASDSGSLMRSYNTRVMERLVAVPGEDGTILCPSCTVTLEDLKRKK